MDYTTEEYFKEEKKRLYDKIMSQVEDLVENALDKEYAYKEHFEEVCSNLFFDELLRFDFFEYILIEEFTKYRLLNNRNAFSSFLKLVINESYLTYDIQYSLTHYTKISVENNVAKAKKELICLEDEIGFVSEFSSIPDLINKSLVGKDEEKKKEILNSEQLLKFESLLKNPKYISSVIIQNETLNKIKLELELIHKTSKIYLGNNIFNENDFEQKLNEIVVDNKEWKRIEQKIFNIALVKKPIGYNLRTVYDEKNVEISPLKWKGTQGQLGALYVELHEKGWIELIDKGNNVDKSVVKTLKIFFNIETKIEKIFKPTVPKQGKGAGEPTWDMIKRGRWEQFTKIKKNPKAN